VARSKEKIVTELNKQVKLACAGVAKHVEDAQRTTGVKDAYTQHWIEYLLEQYKQKKAEGQRPKDIESQLVQWTLDNEDKIYSGFLTFQG
jgi:peptide subunit release factor RF-3